VAKRGRFTIKEADTSTQSNVHDSTQMTQQKDLFELSMSSLENALLSSSQASARKEAKEKRSQRKKRKAREPCECQFGLQAMDRMMQAQQRQFEVML